MVKNKLAIHYMLAVVAFAIVLWAGYLLYQNQQQYKSLLLTIICCSLVGVGQMLVIRQKRKDRKL